MSFITGGATELLYASTAVGTSVSATSETQLNDTTGMGVQARLEPDFWLPNNNQIAKVIHITARGTLTTASTGPNLTVTIRGGSAGTSGPILLASAAQGLIASLTSIWVVEGDIIVSTMGAAGAHSTVQGYGDFISFAAAPVWPWPMTGTAATLDTSVTNFINVNGLYSATGSTIQLQQLLVYGLN